MLIRDGLRNHLASWPPTREFILVVDPQCLPCLQRESYEDALQLAIDLSLTSPSVNFKILIPSYMEDCSIDSRRGHIDPIFTQIDKPTEISPYTPQNMGSEDSRQKLLETTPESKHACNLLALAIHLKADGLITSSKPLQDYRYPIYQHDLVRVVPLEELADFIEVCAHGHSIFWSASCADAVLVDVFYTMTHWKNTRLANWWNKAQSKIINEEMKASLRSSLLNRYPFILYARDMIRFFQLQKDFYSRRGSSGRFGIPLAFYVNAFYLLLWGMLDQLTIITKYANGFKVEESDCGIRGQKFRKELEAKEPGLERFLKQKLVKDWIDVMADFRHAAAHKSIPVPTRLLMKTEDSERPAEEVLQIIKAKDRDSAALLNLKCPPNIMRSIEEMIVSDWRIDNMNVVADHTVYVEGKVGGYTRSPVVSVDYDLSMLTGVMNAFLVKLFVGCNFASASQP